jgi:hypothetical protein
MGILPVLLSLAGFSTRTTRNFGIFFICGLADLMYENDF